MTEVLLPLWDLSDLYSNAKDEKIQKDIDTLKKLAEDFTSQYNGVISKMHGDGLCDAIIKYEEIEKILAKLYSFAYLTYVTDVSSQDSRVLLQKIKDTLSEISAKLVFFQLDITKIEDSHYENIVNNAGKIEKYLPYLRDIRKFKNHTLSEEMEGFSIQKDSAGIGMIVRLFDEHEARLRFKINQKTMTLAESLNCLSDKNPEIRKEAGLEIGKIFKENAWFYSTIINSIAKDKSVMDQYRKYQKSIAARNIANFIEDEVVETLISSVSNKYSSISHRYYKIKAKLLNLPKLNFYDRNAPILVDNDKKYTFDEAKSIVLKAYNSFHPEIGKIIAMFFDKNWIHAEPGEYKNSGAFCCSTTSDLHPYIMMNFMGKARDVSTLAHELGHGVHMYLSRQNGQLMQDTPLTLAETASIFGEQLTFQEMLNNVVSKEERLALLCQKVEDMINSVIRQIAFCQFETKLHNKRKIAELTEDEICDIWLEVQTSSLGEYVDCSGDYRYFWSYISHFIHSPFYVYAYAFGDLLVNSLYQNYLTGNIENFQEKYITMLSKAGTLHHSDLLQPFGLSAKDQNFWNSGLAVIENMINEIETLI